MRTTAAPSITISGCDVNLLDGTVSCQLSLQATFALSHTDPDLPSLTETHALAIGQEVQRRLFHDTLCAADSLITQTHINQAKALDQAPQRRGHRKLTFVTTMGRISVPRQRISCVVNGNQAISTPSAKVWRTPRQISITKTVKHQIADHMVRNTTAQTQDLLSLPSGDPNLLGLSTIGDIMRREGSALAQAQQERAQTVLDQNPDLAARILPDQLALAATPVHANSNNLSEPTAKSQEPSNQNQPESPQADLTHLPESSTGPDQSDENETLPSLTEEEAEELAEFWIPLGFGQDPSERPMEQDQANSKLDKSKRAPDPGFVVLEVDDVQTKAQQPRKYKNKKTNDSSPTNSDPCKPSESKDGGGGGGEAESGEASRENQRTSSKEPEMVGEESQTKPTDATKSSEAKAEKTSSESKPKAKEKEPRKRNRTFTALVMMAGMMPIALVAGTQEDLLKQVGAATISASSQSDMKTLQVLVIADGAVWIRNWFEGMKSACPGMGIMMILCWFHLAKRCYENISMAKLSKAARKNLLYELKGLLWKGELDKALLVLEAAKASAGNPGKLDELIEYLKKRREYIPNYEERREAGLRTASTSGEKLNDDLISRRCKKQGMTWSEGGVLSIGAHGAAKRNGELEEFRETGKLPEFAKAA